MVFSVLPVWGINSLPIPTCKSFSVCWEIPLVLNHSNVLLTTGSKNKFEEYAQIKKIKVYIYLKNLHNKNSLKIKDIVISEANFNINHNKEGNPQYHPKAMLKLLLYGYSYGIRSSRRLERAVYHNITYMVSRWVKTRS